VPGLLAASVLSLALIHQRRERSNRVRWTRDAARRLPDNGRFLDEHSAFRGLPCPLLLATPQSRVAGRGSLVGRGDILDVHDGARSVPPSGVGEGRACRSPADFGVVGVPHHLRPRLRVGRLPASFLLAFIRQRRGIRIFSEVQRCKPASRRWFCLLRHDKCLRLIQLCPGRGGLVRYMVLARNSHGPGPSPSGVGGVSGADQTIVRSTRCLLCAST
jgi:hypothetical protein